METLNTIQERRAVKHFDPDHKIPEEIVEKLMRHTTLAPTAFNIQNWRFVLVKDPAVREKIRAAAWDQAQVTDASLLVILTADLKSWAKEPERYWKNAPEQVQDFIVPAIKQYYEGRDQVQVDEGHRSCGMAGMTLMLTAKALGYDSCPMDGFDYEKVGEIINLPDDHIISFMVAIGKGTKEAWPRGGQLDLEEVCRTDSF